ncbi:MAG: pyruvate, phosphate dikinase [Acidobacteria bacterium]|nr:pyruvate, phosphate dikinase [Acidobacteriota bacterium]
MTDKMSHLHEVIQDLKERAKELRLLYFVEELLLQHEKPPEEVLQTVVEAMPAGWQYPAHCKARVTVRGWNCATPGFRETPWILKAPILVRGARAGQVTVCYTRQLPLAHEGPFLAEERELIDSIARRIGQEVLHRDLRAAFDDLRQDSRWIPDAERADWRIILDLLAKTDANLFKQVSRKMVNYLSCNGVGEAKELLLALSAGREPSEADPQDENRPVQKAEAGDPRLIAERIFRIASDHLQEEAIISLLQVWIKEDRVYFLVEALETAGTSLVEIANAMERYRHTGVKARDLSMATQAGLKTSLVRRLLTDHLDFIEASRKYLEIEDFSELLNHTVLVPASHGKLGGKSSGLFLASHIIRRSPESEGILSRIRTPNTWYIPSDALIRFIAHNDLDDVYNWKYRDIDQIRQEYPHILQVFKGSHFPPELVKGISTALDDLGDRPLIVRSSSLLEDRMGTAFSGKYKSLFLANQGDKAGRLSALLDAIAEVYASVFGPDPIQYRAERHMLDLHEEMGIMIQEVVGTRVGRFFLPAFAGVGFSNNEFRWSPRIKRDDGLLRLVPGLGTRAVDRLADDYPVLVSPGQPRLRVNVTPEETARYSPKKIDVINLEANAFQTVDLRDLLREVGPGFPALEQLVSIYDGDRLKGPALLAIDFDNDDVVFTFEGLVTRTPFMAQMKALLQLLSNTLHTPADIEFAFDGRDFYLLQCRPQSYSLESTPSPIPRDLPESQVVFSATRYVSNGRTPDITHIVYVDPHGYGRLDDLKKLKDVARAVGRLNKILPKRKFILMGPGRWGSRGDIKLGVNVTYSEINNTAMLIEIARKQGNYVPDLSFGTHFFQDLVESSIRYLPLYPDDPGVTFREEFLKRSPNLFPHLLSEYAHLQDTVHVIDVPAATGGRVLRILMNADLDEAMGILVPPGDNGAGLAVGSAPAGRLPEDHSLWRLRMAQKIAEEIDPERFGVRGMYVIGSTRNGTAGPDADIDLIVHFQGTQEMKCALEYWLEGWSRCLSEMNFLRSGCHTDGLLDTRIVTDEDIAGQSGYAAKIGAVTDAARPLSLRR